MRLILHNYWRSSASYRVRIGLNLKQLPWEYVAVNIIAPGDGDQHGAAYRARNPMAQVPTLEVVEDDGSSCQITQSMAILEYLDDRWPEPCLLPADPFRRARARAIAEVVNSGIQPLQNLTTTNKVKAMGGDDRVWVQSFIADGLAALEKLAADTAGRFCVGDLPTIADCCVVPQMYSAGRFGVPSERFPLLTRIWEACEQLPAFAAAHPDLQPDCVTRKS